MRRFGNFFKGIFHSILVEKTHVVYLSVQSSQLLAWVSWLTWVSWLKVWVCKSASEPVSWTALLSWCAVGCPCKIVIKNIFFQIQGMHLVHHYPGSVSTWSLCERMCFATMLKLQTFNNSSSTGWLWWQKLLEPAGFLSWGEMHVSFKIYDAIWCIMVLFMSNSATARIPSLW